MYRTLNALLGFLVGVIVAVAIMAYMSHPY